MSAAPRQIATAAVSGCNKSPLDPVYFKAMSRSADRITRLRSRGRLNREKLLREAERLLSINGDGGVRFSDVFEAAGVSRGSAYRIYIGIDDLMQDLAGEWINNFVHFLSDEEPAESPTTWMLLSDFIVERASQYWTATAETLKVMPRIRSNSPASYRTAVIELSGCIAGLFDRYFEMPDIPDWNDKISFYTQICDTSFSDAVRVDGAIGEQRIAEAQALCRTFLSFYLPGELPPRSD